MLTDIHLSISSACEADCIYCPSGRGTRIGQKMMSVDLVKRIVDEVASATFRQRHQIAKFNVSENGDAFLNKHLIEILRYIRQLRPAVTVEMFNSFQRCSPEKSQAILEEGLVDSFLCTLNGSSGTSFRAAKRLDWSIVRTNLLSFLDARRRTRSAASLVIMVVTARQYIDAVRRTFGVLPSKLAADADADLQDDYAAVRREWAPLLNPARDAIFRAGVFGWAERETAARRPFDGSRYSCPELSRIQHEAFIAPDGTWYACCRDSRNELVFGSAATESLAALYECDSRRELIDRLERHQFAEIGGPCATVNACQELDPGFEAKAALKRLIGPRLTRQASRLRRRFGFV